MNNERKDESLFYCDIEETITTRRFISLLKKYSIENSKQVYIIKKALGVNKNYDYNIDNIAIILIPKHPILILDYGSSGVAAFEEYTLDFIEDLGHLSDKYDYSKILGRSRRWVSDDLIISKNLEQTSIENYINSPINSAKERKIDLFISLLIGSINNIDVVGIEEPVTLLDKIKQKIILFDGKQSSFIYADSSSNKVIKIQGMAGTGKTELLLHKLKDIYANDKKSKIAFTCFNKVLATDMKNRVPKFFNFMKIDEQIDWNNRLKVFSSWGSSHYPESGLYSYICDKYNLRFYNLKENRDFNDICKKTSVALDSIKDFDFCFDYIFIDESQDFEEEFFKLCEKITRKKVYIAGDIFQKIYDRDINTNISPDYLLNKCYRTDPKTLMFAHAVGMGLYEEHPINWLEDTGWESCGYIYERGTENFSLSRSPLRRFEDLNATNTIKLIGCCKDDYIGEVLKCIDLIKSENEKVEPHDIAIVILANYQATCKMADSLDVELFHRYDWESSIGYETKEKQQDKIYISNINNIKGLEFPFIICVATGIISDSIEYRNSIYMALTRSFLTSYFIVDLENGNFIDVYKKAIEDIRETGKMNLVEPTSTEKDEMVERIKINLTSKNKSLVEIIDEIIRIDFPHLDRLQRDVVCETLGKVAKNSSENDIRKKAITFIKDILGE